MGKNGGSSQHERQADVKDENIIQTRLESDGSVVQVLPDGSTRPLKNETDLEALKAMTDEEIERQIAVDPDVAPVLDEDFWENARLVVPEVIDWFKKTYGKSYQSRIFDILRAHMDERPTL